MRSTNEAQTWRERYEAVLRSPRWQFKRIALAWVLDGCCERCAAPSDRLELHHVHYRTLGRERRADVQLLCPDCHWYADQEREDRRKRAAFVTYCRKKFGEQYVPDMADWEEFEAWLERKERE